MTVISCVCVKETERKRDWPEAQLYMGADLVLKLHIVFVDLDQVHVCLISPDSHRLKWVKGPDHSFTCPHRHSCVYLWPIFKFYSDDRKSGDWSSTEVHIRSTETITLSWSYVISFVQDHQTSACCFHCNHDNNMTQPENSFLTQIMIFL